MKIEPYKTDFAAAETSLNVFDSAGKEILPDYAKGVICPGGLHFLMEVDRIFEDMDKGN